MGKLPYSLISADIIGNSGSMSNFCWSAIQVRRSKPEYNPIMALNDILHAWICVIDVHSC